MSGFAVVMGLPNEPPMAAVIRELTQMRAPHVVVDQRRLALGGARTWSTERGSSGMILVDGVEVLLDEVTGVYTRLSTWSQLPEVSDDPTRLAHVGRIHEALEAWLETTSACVINRTSANDTNNSKPYQALIIRHHFDIPATLVTNDVDAVVAFRQEFGDIVYKSTSGERSIVTSFTDADVERLSLLASAPVQFQEFVPGLDVRAHVVGSEVFATAVESEAVDYRYDTSGRTRMTPFQLPAEIAAECVAVTRRLGLELSGVDLRFADDGRVVCFEVNPSPAYIVYEDQTGQPIAAAIARRLISASSPS